MTITIETAQLARAMKYAANVVDSRNTLPILANVLLRADGDTLELVSTNLDVEFRQVLPLAEGGKLDVTVDARRLSALAQAAGSGSQLKLEVDGSQLAVRNGRSRWKMPYLPSTDFPEMPFDGGDWQLIDINGVALADGLGRVMWSVGDEQVKHYLLGPLLHVEQGKAALAATNGHTLVRAILPMEMEEGAPELILMPKFCRTLESLAAEADAVSLQWSDNKIRAQVGDVVLTAKAIKGTFPDYRRVIPQEADEVVTVDPASLRNAVRRSQVLANEKTRCVKVERAADRLMLSVITPDAGEGRSEEPAQCTEGFATGFNAKYLEQMLDAIGGDTVEIHQAGEGAPARFTRTVDDGVLGVIMPMRV